MCDMHSCKVWVSSHHVFSGSWKKFTKKEWREELMCVIDHPGFSPVAFFLFFPIFSSLPFNFPGPSPSAQCAAPASGRSPWVPLLLVLLAVTWPQGSLDWLSCYLSWRGDRLPSASQLQSPFTLFHGVSPPTDHGKWRSSIFHISSFSRRIEMDTEFAITLYPLPNPTHHRRKNGSMYLSPSSIC